MARRVRTEVPVGVVVCRRALDIIRRVCTDANDWSALEKKVTFRYPDGSLQFEYVLNDGEGPTDQFFQKYRLYVSDVAIALYRSLAPFGSREFSFHRPGDDYDRLVGSDGLGINPAVLTDPLPREWELSETWVVVTFRRRPKKSAQLALPVALERWVAEAAGGLRGEGPPRVHPETLTFGDKLARFAVDLWQSGQTTVNWLVLSLFAFGLEHEPLTSVRVAASDEWLRHPVFER